jgi:hypothetical protein
LSSFSQTDTTKPQTNTPVVQNDTTKIRIKTPVAKLAIKDIIKGDGCQLELKETQVKLIKTEEREKEKDSHIVFLEEKDKNNNFMLGKKDQQLKVSEELTNSLHKELKRGKLEGDVKDIALKMFREFYQFMWMNRSYWEPRLKNA